MKLTVDVRDDKHTDHALRIEVDCGEPDGVWVFEPVGPPDGPCEWHCIADCRPESFAQMCRVYLAWYEANRKYIEPEGGE